MISRARVARYWGIAALAGAVILATGIGQTSLGHTILQKAGVAGEPPSYTSLAFTHPGSLPTQLGPKPANIGVSLED
jgi:hypothetical protein